MHIFVSLCLIKKKKYIIKIIKFKAVQILLCTFTSIYGDIEQVWKYTVYRIIKDLRYLFTSTIVRYLCKYT